MDDIRLQKFFTDSGIMSRRKSEDVIREGRVTINGITASVGDKVNPGKDVVTLDGEEIIYSGGESRTYIMLNKPMGYVTTAKDEKGRKNVCDLVNCKNRVYPVGRLDMFSEGLVLLTDDGELANKITHPSAGITKIYKLTVKGEKGIEFAKEMMKPTELDGYMLKPVTVRYIGEGEVTKDNAKTSVYSVTLSEGRNRQIRRMCENLQTKVVRLERISEGPLCLGDLERGKWRYLTETEVNELKSSTEKNK